MPDEETAPPGRPEKVLAAMVAAVMGLSVAAFFAIIIGTWSGMQREEFASGLWPIITMLPLFGLPIGFVIIIVLLVVSTKRRRQGGHGPS
jgi:TRAP-type C4-dicarboxylate transport system permease small subunit